MVALMQESIGREALLALSNQYESVADALMELVDNPFDYRYGRHLTLEITVEKARGLVTVLDYGGEGMDDRTLQDWIQWGTGHEHSLDDIGQWHVGGKLAAIYLAEDLEIVSRKSGSRDIWRFRDSKWGTRTGLYAGTPELVSQAELARSHADLADLSGGIGFTKVALRRLKPHRYETGILTGKLGNYYRELLAQGQCTIRVQGEDVLPLQIPESPSYRDRTITIKKAKVSPGVTVWGRIWITDRERLRPGRGVGAKAGVRTLYNGRLITEGEEFGHYLAGRGQLQRLMGEVSIHGIKPNTTKTGWDTDSPEWAALEKFMREAMHPLVTYLNQLSEARPVPREQQKRAENVRRDLRVALQTLAESLEEPNGNQPEDRPSGRRPPTPNGRVWSAAMGRPHGAVRNRTPPPPDAVGRLLRRYAGGGVPPIEFDALGRNPRTHWRDGHRAIVINTSYPLYGELGETESYLADCVVSHLVAAELKNADEKVRRIDEVLWAWGEISGRK